MSQHVLNSSTSFWNYFWFLSDLSIRERFLSSEWQTLLPVIATKSGSRSSHYGARGLAASLQFQDTGSIPAPAQWVNGSGLVVTVAWIWPLTQELHVPWGNKKRKKKKKAYQSSLFIWQDGNHSQIKKKIKKPHPLLKDNERRFRSTNPVHICYSTVQDACNASHWHTEGWSEECPKEKMHVRQRLGISAFWRKEKVNYWLTEKYKKPP